MSEDIQTQQTEQQQQQQPTQEEPKNTSAGTQNTDNRIPYERFKEKVDEVKQLKKRLAELERERDEAERKKLEEQEQYKELADKYRQELEALKQSMTKAKKEAVLAKAGYSAEQIQLLSNTLSAETDEELEAEVEKLKQIIPPAPAYADPSVGNGKRQEPKVETKEDFGRAIARRLLVKRKNRSK